VRADVLRTTFRQKKNEEEEEEEEERIIMKRRRAKEIKERKMAFPHEKITLLSL
jgi:hypothetical protein